jgi:protein JSN1
VASVLLSSAPSNPRGGASPAAEPPPGPPGTDYAEPLPALPPPYFGPDLTPARIRDYRRHIESPACKPAEFDLIAMELLPVLVSAATDPVGNVLVQKLIERGSDGLKSLIIDELGPFLAAIGVHKNGTWVVQKLISWCQLPLHVREPYCHVSI